MSQWAIEPDLLALIISVICAVFCNRVLFTPLREVILWKDKRFCIIYEVSGFHFILSMPYSPFFMYCCHIRPCKADVGLWGN